MHDGVDANLQPTLAVAEALGHGVVVYGADGRPRFADRRVGELIGVPVDRWTDIRFGSVVGTPIDEFGRRVGHDDWPLVRALRHGERVERMLLGFRHPQRTRWFRVTCLPVPDGDRPGRRGAIAVVEDVTGQHEREHELREARALLASAFDASPLPMVVAGASGRVLEANAAFSRLSRAWGRTPGEPWWSFVDPADRPALLRQLDVALSDPGTTVECECRGTDASGEPVVVRVFAAPMIGTGSGPGAAQLSVQISDITELRRSEARYRTLTETVPVGIFDADRSGRFIEATPRMTAMITSSGSLLGRAAHDFVHPDQQDLVKLHFAQAIAGHHAATEYREYRVIHDDGHELNVLASFRPVIGPDGHVDSVIGATLDLTEHVRLRERLRELGRDMELLAAQQTRERLEAELAQAQRFESIGRLAGGVAHDFNNLLGVISNYAGFLAKRADLPEGLRRDVDQIAEAARRGAGLTRQLLLFSRREQLRPHRFDVSVTLRELGAMMSRPLHPRITLTVDAEAGTFVEADQGQIEQMVLNLLINARDALPEGGTISLRARRRDSDRPWVHIEVTDDGVGMTPQAQARAFEPFFTTKPRSEASGLGLATVQGIVEQAGGRVTVDSVPGRGTTVSILLPAA